MVIPIQPTIPFFEGNGYDTWRIKMRTLFISEDLWELVDKGYVEKEIRKNGMRDVQKNDAKALFFIQQAIAESIFPEISKATKSKEAWDTLQKNYQSKSQIPAPDGDGSQTDKNKREEERKKERKEHISQLQKQGETHLIVSALITTVTFAAGFTLPGGYKEDDGQAILSKKAAFRAFVVTDSIAMISSLCAVFLHFFMTMRTSREFLGKHLRWASILTMVGMGAMAIAFTTGLCAVLPHSSGLSVFTCILCSCFFVSIAVECCIFWRVVAFKDHTWKNTAETTFA